MTKEEAKAKIEREYDLAKRRIKLEASQMQAKSNLIAGLGLLSSVVLLAIFVPVLFPAFWAHTLATTPGWALIFGFAWLTFSGGFYTALGVIGYRKASFAISYVCDNPDVKDFEGSIWEPRYWKIWSIKQWTTFFGGQNDHN